MAYDLEHALSHLLAYPGGGVGGLVTYAPLGGVQYAPKPYLVPGVIYDAQVGYHIPDLFAVKETGAADYPVGHTGLGEHPLKS